MAFPVAEMYSQPTSTADVERLVQRLYLPGSSNDIAQIQDTLQSLQRTPEGWQLADVLLQSPDHKVRFFGALTFTIKINRDWDSLDDNASIDLLQRLLFWLVKVVSAGEGALVVRKLCSALVAYYFRSSRWKLCIKHVLSCFYASTALSEDDLTEDPSTEWLSSQLKAPQLVATLWFTTALIEEVGKISPDSTQTYKHHERIICNSKDVVQLLHRALNISATKDTRLAQEGMKCFQSWVLNVQRRAIDRTQTVDPFNSLATQAISFLGLQDMFDVTQEFLDDILSNFPTFFSKDNYNSLVAIFCSDTAQHYLYTLRSGDFDSEPLAFGRLFLTFGDAYIQELQENIDNVSNRQLLHQLLSLLKCEGYAAADDEICSQALDFWIAFNEKMIDCLFETKRAGAPWMDAAKIYVVQATEALWAKIKVPPPEIASTWDSDAKVGFKAFRADVEDLVQTAYTLLGIEIFQHFARLALEMLSNRAWYHLEASLFCLNALSEPMAEDVSGDESITKLLESDLFTIMACDTSSVPAKAQQTAVTLITRFTSFFDRNTKYLPQTLNFLFISLKSPSLAEVSAKSIHAMCSTCRKDLVSDINAFLDQYEMILSWGTVESGTKEKVVGAIAAIIQAITAENEQWKAIDRLIAFIEADVRQFLHLQGTNRFEEAQSIGLGLLRCLSSMGKALQVPDEVAIDLDAEKRATSIWEQDQGRTLQSRIVHCYGTVLTLMRHDGDIVEETCQILRSGYPETIPGPFVFSPTVTGDLVTSSDLNTARLGYVIDTAGIMLCRHSASKDEILPTALKCAICSFHLIDAIDRNPSNDPEVASSCINLVEEGLIPRFLDVLIDPQIQPLLPGFLSFTLRCLMSTEILPKRSAARFWTSFLQIRKQSQPFQQLIDDAILEYGPVFAHALIKLVAGEAARSELETVTMPLKALVSRHAGARQWLEAALFSDLFPSRKVGDVEKRIWLQKIMNLRGAKHTHPVVREFWMVCRGTNLTFGS